MSQNSFIIGCDPSCKCNCVSFSNFVLLVAAGKLLLQIEEFLNGLIE
jgi:hypothetical protein